MFFCCLIFALSNISCYPGRPTLIADIRMDRTQSTQHWHLTWKQIKDYQLSIQLHFITKPQHLPTPHLNSGHYQMPRRLSKWSSELPKIPCRNWNLKFIAGTVVRRESVIYVTRPETLSEEQTPHVESSPSSQTTSVNVYFWWKLSPLKRRDFQREFD